MDDVEFKAFKVLKLNVSTFGRYASEADPHVSFYPNKNIIKLKEGWFSFYIDLLNKLSVRRKRKKK